MNTEHPLLGVRFPDSLKAICDAIGLDDTIKLVSTLGGTRVFIPKHIGAGHRLVHLLGWKAARKLSLLFGGECLSVVRGAPALRAQRNKEIIAQYNRGVRVADLARSFALTERRIYTILARDDGNR
ncbi:MAG: hypothetical protein HQL73_04935 [Magnetococcales bacterium]|nr:hypothetical protein [Magnetococcales bacterium]